MEATRCDSKPTLNWSRRRFKNLKTASLEWSKVQTGILSDSPAMHVVLCGAQCNAESLLCCTSYINAAGEAWSWCASVVWLFYYLVGVADPDSMVDGFVSGQIVTRKLILRELLEKGSFSCRRGCFQGVIQLLIIISGFLIRNEVVCMGESRVSRLKLWLASFIFVIPERQLPTGRCWDKAQLSTRIVT